MTRRELFGVPLLLLPGAFLLNPVEAAEPRPFRRWWRFMRDSEMWYWDKTLCHGTGGWSNDPWCPIEFEDIREGMEIWVEDSVTGNEVVYASSDCIRGQFFTVGARIDPATNTWVDVPCRNTN